MGYNDQPTSIDRSPLQDPTFQEELEEVQILEGLEQVEVLQSQDLEKLQQATRCLGHLLILNLSLIVLIQYLQRE